MTRHLLILILLLTFAGCATTPHRSAITAGHDVTVDTLQSPVNISLKTASGQIGGNGVLIYKRPANFRLTVLAPFGQSIFDIIINDNNFLCLVDSKKSGWQGEIGEMPEWLGIRIWPLIKWGFESPHPSGGLPELRLTSSDGTMEKIFYDSAGLVMKKLNTYGDQVIYRDYQIIDGAAVPMIIEFVTVAGDTLKLRFEDTEINRPVDRDVLNPSVEGYDIQPLADFRGF